MCLGRGERPRSIRSPNTSMFRVRSRIFRSRPNDEWSTYQISRASFSRSDSRVLPLTWAQPVKPGSTVHRITPRGPKAAIVSGRSGRGPTKARSPDKTASNCGISSNRMRRMKRVTAVSRSRSGSSRPSLSRKSYIVRNFTMLKVRPPRPQRSCRNSSGRPRVNHTAMAVSIAGIAAITNSGGRQDHPERSADHRAKPVGGAGCDVLSEPP